MKVQVLQDNLGNETGVYVPIKDWEMIKENYPDIETVDQDISQYEKDLIDERLAAIEANPNRLKPGDELLKELKRRI